MTTRPRLARARSRTAQLGPARHRRHDHRRAAVADRLVEAHALETAPARSAMISARARVIAARQRARADAIALVQAVRIEKTLLGLGHEVGRAAARAAVVPSAALLALLLQALVVGERAAAAGADVLAAVARRPTGPIAEPLDDLARRLVDRVRARPRRRLIRPAPTGREHLDPAGRTRALVAARRARVVAVRARPTADATARRHRIGAGRALGRERGLAARTVRDEVGRARAVRRLGRVMRVAGLLIAVVDAAVELPAPSAQLKDHRRTHHGHGPPQENSPSQDPRSSGRWHGSRIA